MEQNQDKIPPQRHLSALPPQNLPSLPSGCTFLSCSLTQISEIPPTHNRLNMTERDAEITREQRRGGMENKHSCPKT